MYYSEHQCPRDCCGNKLDKRDAVKMNTMTDLKRKSSENEIEGIKYLKNIWKKEKHIAILYHFSISCCMHKKEHVLHQIEDKLRLFWVTFLWIKYCRTHFSDNENVCRLFLITTAYKERERVCVCVCFNWHFSFRIIVI